MVTGVSRIPIRPRTDADMPLTASAAGTLPAFICGPENRLLDTVYRCLLIDNNLCESGFSPVVLFGPPGFGKSHLALGLSVAWRQQHPTARVCIITARDWAVSYATALRTDRVPAWRDAQREFDLFVIEDISQLHKRVAAQRELATLLDDFSALDVRCLVTARANPIGMSELTPELASRLISGLAVPLLPPEIATRKQIAHELAAQRNCELTDEAATYLATSSGNAFSSLRQSLLRCCIDQPQKRRLGISDVRRSLSTVSTSCRLPLSTISTAVARYFGIAGKQIVGPSRRQAVTRARGIAIYLCRQLTDASLKDVGRHFGNRDHTTIIHACQITEKRSRTESDTQTAIDDLKALLQSLT